MKPLAFLAAILLCRYAAGLHTIVEQANPEDLLPAQILAVTCGLLALTLAGVCAGRALRREP